MGSNHAMNRGKFGKNKGFLRGLERLMSAVPERRAPSHFADRVLDRWREEPPFAWSLRGSLAAAGAVAALMVLFWQQPLMGKPQILSFGFDKAAVKMREPVTLRWEVANVERVQIKIKNGGVLKDVPVTAPTASGSLTMLIAKPGKWSFELVAFTGRGSFSRPLGAH